MNFSIVIPAYNRAWCIERALRSAVNFLKTEDKAEIIIIDDHSTDNTNLVIKNFINQHLNKNIKIELISSNFNEGVCKTKNNGARNSKADWIIFLDSDDEILRESIELKASINKNNSYPLHFFKSINETSCLLSNNKEEEKQELVNLNRYFLYGTKGEALPVVKREVFLQYLYDEDINGYEGLCYMRIIRDYEFCVLHNLILRRYYTEHEDRLSSKVNIQKRYLSIAKGHIRSIKENHKHMSSLVLVKQVLRLFKAISKLIL
jgi:glycosyltransferase involved in cell wall biosynthesis